MVKMEQAMFLKGTEDVKLVVLQDWTG
jgi:hypothetical protein